METVDRVSQVESNRRKIAMGAAAVAVVFVVLSFLAGWGWVVVALGAAAIAVYQWLAASKEQRTAAAEAQRAKESLSKDMAQRVESFTKARTELRTRQLTVNEDLAALRKALS
jgi:type III secretory pathway component EscV